ncbi:MAG: DUF4157 domain-containing protein [Pseudomonadota bacterium]
MSHLIGKIRRRARRGPGWSARGGVEAVRKALRGSGLAPKLTLGPANDAAEREADATAARVMNRAEPGHADGPLRRMCADCAEEAESTPDGPIRRQAEEEEETMRAMPQGATAERGEEDEEPLQARRGAEGHGPAAPAAVTRAGAALTGSGQPLPKATRGFFEARLGTDLSAVRVHTGPEAGRAARGIGARAYARGAHIAFAAGEYQPGTRRGDWLLAHELAHVLQSRRGAQAPIRRWSVGAAPVPFSDWSLVPNDPSVEDHTGRLAAARTIVNGVVSSRGCVNYFRDHCGRGEGASALSNAFSQAQVYFRDVDDNTYGEAGPGSRNIAYNRRAYRIGARFLAGSLLHEMLHTCNPIGDPALEEQAAEGALDACRLYTPFIELLSRTRGSVGDVVEISGVGFGAAQGSADRVEIGGVEAEVLSWRFGSVPGASFVVIRARIPAGAKTGHLVVINNNVPSNRRRFTIL